MQLRLDKHVSAFNRLMMQSVQKGWEEWGVTHLAEGEGRGILRLVCFCTNITRIKKSQLATLENQYSTCGQNFPYWFLFFMSKSFEVFRYVALPSLGRRRNCFRRVVSLVLFRQINCEIWGLKRDKRIFITSILKIFV